MRNVIFLLSLILFYCTPRIEDDKAVEKNKSDTPLITHYTEANGGEKLSDTCFIVVPIKKGSSPANIDCAYIAWMVEEGSIIKLVNNTDLGVEVSYLGKENMADVFLLYDLPTGRQKIFVMDLEMGFKESNWFDNSALGDSVLLNTITNKGFKVFTIEGNKEYDVNWKNR
jgi:hypothetical protein